MNLGTWITDNPPKGIAGVKIGVYVAPSVMMAAADSEHALLDRIQGFCGRQGPSGSPKLRGSDVIVIQARTCSRYQASRLRGRLGDWLES